MARVLSRHAKDDGLCLGVAEIFVNRRNRDAMLKCSSMSDADVSSQLAILRDRLDGLDRQLISVLAERLDVCREVAAAKEAGRRSVIVPERVAAVYDSRREWAEVAGVDADFAEQIFRTLLAETHRIESSHLEANRGAPASVRIETPAFDPASASPLEIAACRIDHVTLPVVDLAFAESLFVDDLGFHVSARAENWALVEAGGVAIVLHRERRWNPAERLVGHLALEVLDVGYVHTALGAKLACGPIETGTDQVQSFVVSDPRLFVRLAFVSRVGGRSGAVAGGVVALVGAYAWAAAD